MKLLIASILSLILISDNPLIIDFSKPSASENWKIINDGVMGGLSTGKVIQEDGYLNYTGIISFENNGGFSSFRSKYNQYQLEGFKTVEIEYALTGGDCSFTLETAYQFFEPYYAINLSETDGEWTRAAFDFSLFKQTVLGKQTGSYFNPNNLDDVIRIGFLKNDKKEGKFQMKIRKITFR